MKNDIHARHSRTTGNVTAKDSHDSLHHTCDTSLYKISNFNVYLKWQCLMKVFCRKFFSEWMINECVVSVSVSPFFVYAAFPFGQD